MPYTIDWDNLPICGEPPVLIVSTYVCQQPDGWTPPGPIDPPPDKCKRQVEWAGAANTSDCTIDTPPTAVPVPGTLPLFLAGALLLARARRLRK